jgi:hypothetical protein
MYPGYFLSRALHCLLLSVFMNPILSLSTLTEIPITSDCRIIKLTANQSRIVNRQDFAVTYDLMDVAQVHAM